jgi:predicted metal-dependent peptidase
MSQATLSEITLKGLKFHNVCMDLAINCYLPFLTNYSNDESINKEYQGVTIEQMEKKFNIKLQSKQSYEYYVEKLAAHAEKINQEFDSLDSHEGFGEPGDSSEQLKDLVRKALAKSTGSVPGELKQMLEALLNPKVNWKQQLRIFAHSIKSREKERTRRKYNRRYGLLNPGKRKKDTTKIAVAVDTSGSMWQDLPKVMAEVYEIAKHSEVWIIESDAEVKHCYKADPKKLIDFSGGGGTKYQPAIDKAVEIGASGLIYLGDMDCCDRNELKRPPFNTLWGVFGSSEAPASWGKTLKIES